MQIGNRTVAVAAGSFVVLVAIIAFLLGRESSRRHPAVTVAQPGAVAVPVAPVAAPPVAPPTMGMPTPPPASWSSPPPVAVRSTPAPVARPSEAPVEAPSPPAHTDREAAAVRDYFTQISAIQAVTPGSGDVNEFANKLLTAALNGDNSGFDGLIKTAEDARARAQAIAPPAPCAHYHETTLAMLADTVDMVKQIKSALKKNDPSSFAALASSGNAMKSRADALEAEAKALKSKYGI